MIFQKWKQEIKWQSAGWKWALSFLSPFKPWKSVLCNILKQDINVFLSGETSQIKIKNLQDLQPLTLGCPTNKWPGLHLINLQWSASVDKCSCSTTSTIPPKHSEFPNISLMHVAKNQGWQAFERTFDMEIRDKIQKTERKTEKNR